MNKPLLTILIPMIVSICEADTIEIINRTVVTPEPEAQIVIRGSFETAVQNKSQRIGNDKYYLDNGNGEKVYCSQISYGNNQMRMYFPISTNNFVVFEKLVSDSTGYFLNNTQDISIGDSIVKAGELRNITENKIRKIKPESWNSYVLNAYSANYLFPPTFDFGTELGLNDSAKTGYYLHFIQSGKWGEKTPIYWGAKGRWSTVDNDKANFLQFYPITFFLPKTPFGKVSFGTGIESGYLGVSKEGRAVLKTDIQFRLPFNPIDLTLGSPRVRVNPVITLSAQYNNSWSDTTSTEIPGQEYDANVNVRYGIPISDNYYLEIDSKVNYASKTQTAHYLNNISFGYIANGTIRIAAAYQQGYQEVSYVFDRKLVLGFAFDILNKETAQKGPSNNN